MKYFNGISYGYSPDINHSQGETMEHVQEINIHKYTFMDTVRTKEYLLKKETVQ